MKQMQPDAQEWCLQGGAFQPQPTPASGPWVSDGNGLPTSQSSDCILEPRAEPWREIPSTGLYGKGLHLSVF